MTKQGVFCWLFFWGKNVDRFAFGLAPFDLAVDTNDGSQYQKLFSEGNKARPKREASGRFGHTAFLITDGDDLSQISNSIESIFLET